jgi:hypothetical protein
MPVQGLLNPTSRSVSSTWWPAASAGCRQPVVTHAFRHLPAFPIKNRFILCLESAHSALRRMDTDGGVIDGAERRARSGRDASEPLGTPRRRHACTRRAGRHRLRSTDQRQEPGFGIGSRSRHRRPGHSGNDGKLRAASTRPGGNKRRRLAARAAVVGHGGGLRPRPSQRQRERQQRSWRAFR